MRYLVDGDQLICLIETMKDIWKLETINVNDNCIYEILDNFIYIY